MKKNILKLGLLLLILAFIMTGCALKNQENKVEQEKIKIMVTILPLIEFVEKVGGEMVEVEAIIPPGYEPHSYEFIPNTLTKISKADLYIQAGHLEFEKNNINKIIEQNKEMRIIDGSKGIDLRNLEEHSHYGEEDYDHEEEIIEGAKDPHTWLSVENAKIYTENIYQALAEFDAENKDLYNKNKGAYLNELDELDEYLGETMSLVENKKIIVYHPAFGYLLDEYGFEQISIEVEGKEPTIEELEDLISEAREENIKVVFVQKEFSTKSAEVIAKEISGTTIQIDVLAKDFTNNLRNIGKLIAENLQ